MAATTLSLQGPHTRVSSLIIPKFYPAHDYIRGHQYTVYWLEGGRGSTKSSFVAIQIILGMMRDPMANAVCIRKVASTLRDSVLATLVWAINALGVADRWGVGKSPPEMVYKPTGQVILMKGLDEPAKMKSIRPKHGYFNYLWFEEVPELGGMHEVRSVEQSVMRGGTNFIEFITYNPPNDPHAWVNKEAVARRAAETKARAAGLRTDTYIIHSTYLDVPEDWLGPAFIKKAKHLQATDPLAYDHEYLGKAVGRADAIIFSGRYRIEAFTPQPHWAGPYQGVDWGFANDPTFATRWWVDNTFREGMKKRLYCEYEAVGAGVDMDDIPTLFGKIPDFKKYKIRADNSRPETISHVRRMGFDIEPAEKWAGSVEDGVEWFKQFEIILHPRCVHMHEEARLYAYKVDKLTGDVLPVIVDKFNHGWDSGRYAMDRLIKKAPEGLFDVL